MGINFMLFIFIVFQLAILFKYLQVKKQLTRDDLTKLYSRKTYNEFCKSKNSSEGVTFLLNLNNFKKVNDLYGHEEGDLVLYQTSLFLKKVFKKDEIFRISGDEFYIFSHSNKTPTDKIEKLKELFSDSFLMKKYNTSFTLGYHKKSSCISLHESFKCSDMAMSAIKKNNELWYKEATNNFIERARRNEKIKSLLENSINSEFYAVFQPKYNLSDNSLSGAEALARWENNDLKFISPAEFIPLAEKMGIVYKIDYKIAEEAIKKVAVLLEKKSVTKDFRLSFNMSSETFMREDMVPYIFDLLDFYKVDGKNIEIEITETMILNNSKTTIERLEKLKEKDILISMDDFTAGYSTVGLLATLPVDIVKFDRSLILAMNEDDQKGKVIYKGLVKIMKSLGLKIVAEGIEKEEDLEFLIQNSVEYGQGFLLGKPQRDFLI
ncbi:bifunctional diguanylate cyclase/phosphodiesterase [uncultured Cetobacterium sp.]|uniref:bifunctional diguanylate cyclase/phosphodiesterase n=1 Tax=uncultured Cetobacterium sp. TaxID=527638 RepID=UPI0025D7F701|nr:bifunctional diguanylate cyclase/phosphodiesterase [uncultured Cetobacterium sp.]